MTTSVVAGQREEARAVVLPGERGEGPRPLSGLRGGRYARKSAYRGKSARRGFSVREQLTATQGDADRLGVGIVEDFIDDDRSASRFRDREREEFERMIEWIEGGKLDIVFAWGSSRLQRDLEVYTRLRNTCAKYGVLWCYGGKVYDLSNKDDRFRTGLDALIGEREVDELRDNVKRTLRSNAVLGRPHGISAYGYRRVYDPRTGAFVCEEADPDKARVVLEIGTRVANAEPYKTIATDLQARGIQPPALRWSKGMVTRLSLERPSDPAHEGLWTEAVERLAQGEEPLSIAQDFNERDEPLIAAVWHGPTVKDIAMDVRYTGARRHNGVVTNEAAWPQIVPPHIHAKCVALDKAKGRKPSNSRPGVAKYLLSSIMCCSECKHPVVSDPTEYGMNYQCKTPGKDGAKGYHVSGKQAPIDEYVLAELFDWLASPAFVKAYTEGDRELQERVANASAEAELLTARLEGFRDKAAEGELSADGLAAMEARLLPKIKQAEDVAKALRAPEVVADLAGASREEITKAWANLHVAQRRVIVESLLTITLHPVGKGRHSRAGVPISSYVTVTRKVLRPQLGKGDVITAA
ncbi:MULTISPECIES: recombinase family protein [unclassified Streptomyces]|uniref:recombinase family protein n=1 Tax=unclassified Streptomyces TaxID=2593676 RepID=UPI00099CEE69|nr:MULTISPECIES: recombinase family protein [unclassified Streptomyces]